MATGKGGDAILLKGLKRAFGAVVAVDGVDLRIEPGEFFSLLGPSGCGKTTVLRLIAGFEKPDGGEIEIGGKPVHGLPPNQRHVNTVFQNYALFPHLSVFENVAFPLRLKKLPKKQIEEEVAAHLALVRLEAFGKRMPQQLSGGQKQRVAIARALINKPGVLLLDEPLSALDAKLRRDLLLELDKLHSRLGITFILVTHDQEEALSVSDRVAVMRQGRILQVGTPKEVYHFPRDPFVSGFIGETNLLEGSVVGIDGNRARVQTAFGEVRSPFGAVPAVGAAVNMALRPESILLGDSGRIKGTVDEVIYTGPHLRVEIQTEIGLLKAMVREATQNIRKGDAMGIDWQDENLWILENK